MRCVAPSMMSVAPMLMMLQPMEEAEMRASVWFSWMVNKFSLPLFMARSSIVLATDVLMSLLRKDEEREREGEEANEDILETKNNTLYSHT